MTTRQTIYHFLYWITAYFLLVLLFSISGEIVQSIIFSSLLIPIIIFSSYFFVYTLVPRLWFRGEKVIFWLATAATVFFVIQVKLLVLAAFLITFGDYDIVKVNPRIHDIYAMITASFIISFPAIIIETIHQWSKSKQVVPSSERQPKQLVFRSEGKNVIVRPESIDFAESFGDVIKIHTDARVITTRKSLSWLESEMSHFIRIHRSYLVNPKVVKSYTHEVVFVQEHELPVGRTYKDDFLKKIEQVDN